MNYGEILRKAQQLATTQGRLATSPAGLNKDGTVTLCAASCIAKVAIELSGDADAAADFDRRVLTQDKDSFVPALFQKYGLSAEQAKQIMLENDSQSESARLAWFQSLTA